ncbi:MAG: AI-2E family transporter [Firmicutes bacterium]|nr:AI-2E family transporter [Bacillota bacterium]
MIVRSEFVLNKKINIKLINLVLIAILVWILVATSDFWLWSLDKIIEILMPFVIAFSIAYVSYPFLKFMEKKGIPKWLGVGIIIIILVGFVSLIISLLIPLVYEQTISLLSNAIKFIQDISIKYEINLNYIQSGFSNLNSILVDLGKFISDSAFHIISKSIGVITNIIIAFFTGIYFLADMDYIREEIKDFFRSKSKKTYNYIKALDIEMKNYCIGLVKYIFVQLIEYIIVFYLIGHPYFLILGILAAFTTIIPYFGGIFTNIIALITALVVSPKLFVLTLIVSIVLPNIDGYFWSPRIYGKTNNIHPILSIFGVFAGGALFGVTGIIIALPVTIILSQTYKYYRTDIKKLKKKNHKK